MVTKEQKLRYNKQQRERRKNNNEEVNNIEQEWRKNNIEKVKVKRDRDIARRFKKGGEKYKENCEYKRTGIQKDRNNTRRRDRKIWQPYKKFIALNTEVHHAWINNTAKYNGIAIVDKSEHQHGIVNPILILNMSLLTCPNGKQMKWL